MRILLLVVLLFTTTSSVAGSASGTVARILVHTGGGNGQGVLMFSILGERGSPPACSIAGGGKEWAVSLDNESGRAIYALLLTAQVQNKKLSVLGKGHCNAWGDREEPQYLYLESSE